MVGNSASLKGVNYSRGGIAFTKAPYFLSSLCVPTQMNKNSKTKPNRNILNPANEYVVYRKGLMLRCALSDRLRGFFDNVLIRHWHIYEKLKMRNFKFIFLFC